MMECFQSVLFNLNSCHERTKNFRTLGARRLGRKYYLHAYGASYVAFGIRISSRKERKPQDAFIVDIDFARRQKGVWNLSAPTFTCLQAAVGRGAGEIVMGSTGDLYALDFDGVLCDSCGESSLSAVKAAKIRWPEIFVDYDEETESWILDAMQTVRPVVETGYENLLLVRLLLEIRRPQAQNSPVSQGLTIEQILDSWETIKPQVQSSWGETNKEELVDLFGTTRDKWIKSDTLGWVKANRFYPGTADALKFSTSTVYIVTTKQARFAALLLKEIAGVEIPQDHIYGLGSGPKVEVLKKLQALPSHEGLALHFVEDRLATLRNVIKDSELNEWHLYLGTWGYNTEKERSAAASVSRINVIDLPEFCTKLK